MDVDDLDAVMPIEVECFSVPWTREAYVQELTNNRFARYFVLEFEDKIVGYGGMWIVLDEVHITNIAVSPAFQGKKLGEAILAYMMDVAKSVKAMTMTLEVRVSNKPAQGLYRKLGFQDGGIRKQYYTDNQEDALVMWVKL
ncbi:ribosomal protein S18-alanine N-acetyltransferase [Mangrovibacillus cuniculi]|uniref:[Ribosomal protein bS18]-alanine N-acetyltransferase n=2 Tax=Mangrovibacillus cuniculi TaxID=2593652 RepID=A0A7S8CEG6_9BACI|nr:ribosomal protein S18-alanine N-acetyltransferase [Mangrovibacillus cuniculi]